MKIYLQYNIGKYQPYQTTLSVQGELYQVFGFCQKIFDIREAEAGYRDELADNRHKLISRLRGLRLLIF